MIEIHPNTDQNHEDHRKMTLVDLNQHILDHQIIESYLIPQEQAKLRGVNRFFKYNMQLNTRLACYFVLTGQPDALLALLTKKPELFFHQYRAMTFKAANQVFYNVSPADLIYFLYDGDLWNKIKTFASTLAEEQQLAFFKTWQKQQQTMGKGGADLLYMTGHNPPTYSICFETTTHFDVMNETLSLTRTLLKNPDGLVGWKSPDHQLYLYYANPKTKTLDPIRVNQHLSEAKQVAYQQFQNSMTAMEPNTVRRSSNPEHRLFQSIFTNRRTNHPIKLKRSGIHYEQNGIDYIDTHHDFNRLTNVYLKYIPLSRAAHAEQNMIRKKTLSINNNVFWRTQLGQHQKEVIWILQRLCGSHPPVDHAPQLTESDFHRSFIMFTWITTKDTLLFNTKTGLFLAGFGVNDSKSGFAIHQGTIMWGKPRNGTFASPWGIQDGIEQQFIHQNRFIKAAINTVEAPIEPPVDNLTTNDQSIGLRP